MADTVSGVEADRRPRGRPFVKRAAIGELNAAPPSTPASSSPAPIPELQAPRRQRVRNPFGGMSQKMKRPERPGYHRHWFNDDQGRIAEAKAGGYEQVLNDKKEPESMAVGTTKTGGVLLAYLMEIPQEYYQEDMADQQARVDEQERGYKRGADKHGEPGVDGRYIPARGIKINVKDV